MKNIWVGIDNGTTGTIGVIAEGKVPFMIMTPIKFGQDYTAKKKNISRIVLPDLLELLEVGIYQDYDPSDCRVFVALERPMVNPKQWTTSETAMRAFEVTWQAVELLGLAHETIPSTFWQKQLLPAGTKGEAALKAASKTIGSRLFPECIIEEHPDMDGILIAEWARRNR